MSRSRSNITVIGGGSARVVITTPTCHVSTMVTGKPNTITNSTVNVDPNGNIAMFTSNSTRTTHHHHHHHLWDNPTAAVAAAATIHQQVHRVPKATTTPTQNRKSNFPSNNRDEKKKKTGSSPSFLNPHGSGGGVKMEKQSGGSSVKPVKKESNGGVGVNLNKGPIRDSNCDLCFEMKEGCEMFRGSNCKHLFCADCIAKHVADQIQQENSVLLAGNLSPVTSVPLVTGCCVNSRSL